MANIITEFPHFFTATILEWNKLLKPVKYKNIIVDSMRFLVDNKRVIIYGFVVVLANSSDGQPLPADMGPFQLAVRGEKRPARSCFKVTEFVIKSDQ